MLGLTLAITLGVEHAGLVAAPLSRTCLTQFLPVFLGFVTFYMLQVSRCHCVGHRWLLMW